MNNDLSFSITNFMKKKLMQVEFLNLLKLTIIPFSRSKYKNKLKMLRLGLQRFSFLLKKERQMPFLSQRLGCNIQTKYFMSTAKYGTEFNEKLLSGKYYEVLGYPQGTDPNALTDSQVKRQYLAMVKKYHSDGVVDPKQKGENEEITKCIIAAFDKISSERIRTQIDKGIYDKIYKDEDDIAMKIYGKKFNEIKYELFKQGNAAKRAQFMEELQKIRKDSKYYDHIKDRQTSTSTNFNQQRQNITPQQLNLKISDDFGSGILKILIPIVGIVGAIAYFYENKNEAKAQAQQAERKKSKLTLGEEKIKQIQKKSTQLYEKKLSDLINSYIEQQPPCLKYPTKEDPEQLQQLVEYTIAPDINLYEVNSDLMIQKDKLDKLKQTKTVQQLKQNFETDYDPYPLNRIKVNTAISLSLEAERCLQNIYIKVKDVADEIEETGKYTPPKVFFRFFGYLMFDLREKPLSLENYRDTEYVSLFDLYFDYYSPIPIKRHEYNEYLVGFKDEDLKMYGQVHLNNRKIPERYITRNDKVVVMKDDIANQQKKNAEIWHNYYRKYMRVWTRGYSDRISTEHQ